jgi:hypothetical protein
VVGGKKVLEKYGWEYFVELRKKREYYPELLAIALNTAGTQEPYQRRVPPSRRRYSRKSIQSGALQGVGTIGG